MNEKDSVERTVEAEKRSEGEVNMKADWISVKSGDEEEERLNR